ncbi:MAG: DNA repair protein RadA, partial [Thermodesulfobacteriota bacterium]
MARVKTVFLCQGCGASSPKWLGRCPECGEWNTYAEEVVSRGPASSPSRRSPRGGPAVPMPITELDPAGESRLSTGIGELDHVLGGGMVPGSAVLIGGDPGIGKSTLLLQAMGEFASS